ncbi:MAG TPA: hypothetical protein VGO24_04380 [Solirubrobacterales bacterium]|jgi:hypothetical protein|nr:hypothetical protein [Solirubrobacterales bacterium]
MNETPDLRPPTMEGGYEPCEKCGAPLDAQQRYCVNCATRRGNGANPSSRYFAAMQKKARKPMSRPASKAPGGSRAAAVGFFALLPIAVALGVVVGRSGSGEGDNAALLKALRQQEAATASAAPAPESATATTAKAKKKKNAKAPKGADKEGGKVVAKTPNGTVHQVTGYKPTKEKEEADTKLVEENPEQAGENYIKAQQNLPDVVVVGGAPGSTPAPTNGAEP